MWSWIILCGLISSAIGWAFLLIDGYASEEVNYLFSMPYVFYILQGISEGPARLFAKIKENVQTIPDTLFLIVPVGMSTIPQLIYWLK